MIFFKKSVIAFKMIYFIKATRHAEGGSPSSSTDVFGGSYEFETAFSFNHITDLSADAELQRKRINEEYFGVLKKNRCVEKLNKLSVDDKILNNFDTKMIGVSMPEEDKTKLVNTAMKAFEVYKKYFEFGGSKLTTILYCAGEQHLFRLSDVFEKFEECAKSFDDNKNFCNTLHELWMLSEGKLKHRQALECLKSSFLYLCLNKKSEENICMVKGVDIVKKFLLAKTVDFNKDFLIGKLPIFGPYKESMEKQFVELKHKQKAEIYVFVCFFSLFDFVFREV